MSSSSSSTASAATSANATSTTAATTAAASGASAPAFWPDRVCNEIPPPAHEPLAHSALFDANGLPNVQALQTHFLQEGRLTKADILEIVRRATALFKAEPNMLEVDAPATVCGDVHGQYYDLIGLFKVGGEPVKTTYLFLGDYVDRGNFGLECVLHLYCLKLLSPTTTLLLRGNHECRHLTEFFTFKNECLYKHDVEVYNAIMDSFDALPLAALLNDQFLCVHGGLSPDIHSIDDIQKINRFMEPPSKGAMCDLLWSDPCEEYSASSSVFFEFNSVRGCSYSFGYKAACEFAKRNELLSIVRAHEAQDAGYKMHLTNASNGFPSCITIFSAPNYLDAYGNKGAVLRYDGSVLNIRQFNHNKHPYALPGFMDVFAWSTPFVAEKVAEMLLVLLKLPEAQPEGGVDAAVAEQRRESARKKIQAVSRMHRMMRTLREERETVLQIKAISPDGRVPKGLLLGGADALKRALGDFQAARAADKPNERNPRAEVDIDATQRPAPITTPPPVPAYAMQRRHSLHRVPSSGGSVKVVVDE